PSLPAHLCTLSLHDALPILAELSARTGRAAAAAAPGAASAPWLQWRPAPGARSDPPGRLRIGAFHLPGLPPVPALVPLLDHGHVDRKSTRLNSSHVEIPYAV